LILLLFNTVFAYCIKIRMQSFNGKLCHRLTYYDSAAIISLEEEEGVDSAFVMKLSYEKLLITMKCEECDIQYILYDRYIQGIVKYYPTKTLFYDKNYKPYKPKTSD